MLTKSFIWIKLILVIEICNQLFRHQAFDGWMSHTSSNTRERERMRFINIWHRTTFYTFWHSLHFIWFRLYFRQRFWQIQVCLIIFVISRVFNESPSYHLILTTIIIWTNSINKTKGYSWLYSRYRYLYFLFYISKFVYISTLAFCITCNSYIENHLSCSMYMVW